MQGLIEQKLSRNHQETLAQGSTCCHRTSMATLDPTSSEIYPVQKQRGSRVYLDLDCAPIWQRNISYHYIPTCRKLLLISSCHFHFKKRATGIRLDIRLTAEVLDRSFTSAVSDRGHVECTFLLFTAVESQLSERQM